MIKFMIVCFLILGWAFYEMSGGSEFEPERRADAQPTEAEPIVASEVDPVEVAQTANEPALADPEASTENVEIALSDPIVTESDGSIQQRLATALVTSAVTEVVLDSNLGASTTEGVLAAVEDVTNALPQNVVAIATETVVETIVPEPSPVDLRRVSGSRVNMRSGPSTDFTVLDTLDGGTATEVIERDTNGWVLVRVQNTGQEGWMAERLLERVNG